MRTRTLRKHMVACIKEPSPVSAASGVLSASPDGAFSGAFSGLPASSSPPPAWRPTMGLCAAVSSHLRCSPEPWTLHTSCFALPQSSNPVAADLGAKRLHDGAAPCASPAPPPAVGVSDWRCISMQHSASRIQSRGHVRNTGAHCSKHLNAAAGRSHISIWSPALYAISGRRSSQCLVAMTPGSVSPAFPPRRWLCLPDSKGRERSALWK
mmetsp:Transcript_80629/g.207575  ORF Transcript_80629/g.207575 Transcript_80629/m.207575 type:complete len:210 (-) Transcript_80629:1408-2037(-)